MSIKDLPDDKKDAIDILAKAGYLSAENKDLKVSLESSNTLNIQPKGSIFGVKLKVEDSGNVTPTLTFDTKKLREKKNIDPESIVNNALDDFMENF